MAYVIHALCMLQTVSLHKMAAAMPTSVERDSNMPRLQRIFAQYVLSLDMIARSIFSLLPTHGMVTLSMDGTNWKFGEADINILMLGITYRGIGFSHLYEDISSVIIKILLR